MIQRPRTPAIATLFIVLAVGVLFLGFARRYNTADAAELAELEKMVLDPAAKPDVWTRYAEKLQAVGKYTTAAAAYQHVLESDSSNYQKIRLQCTVCLALAKNSDDLFAFMQATLNVDPKLTLNLFDRPEVAPYRVEPRYQALHETAVAQSMD